MVTEPKKKKASTKPKASALTGKKDYELTTKKKTNVSVSKSAVDNAKQKKGVFKSIPDYKGKVVKGKKGEVTGVKTHDGKFHRATTPEERRKVQEKLTYDKKLHAASKKKRAGVQKRFSTAKKKPSVSS